VAALADSLSSWQSAKVPGTAPESWCSGRQVQPGDGSARIFLQTPLSSCVGEALESVFSPTGGSGVTVICMESVDEAI
jgi:hypothetical protein